MISKCERATTILIVVPWNLVSYQAV